MGVLTKPDLATERATQQVVVDLVLGKRNNLRLGYCVVKNRSADDESSSLGDRNSAEKAFFKSEPWSQLEASKRTGVNALQERLSALIQDITRKEFPRVRDDIQKKLHASRDQLKALGKSRADAFSQRAFLAEVATAYQAIANDGFDAKYNRRDIFKDSQMKLITRIRESNEVFATVFATKGHKQNFERTETEESSTEDEVKMEEHEEESQVSPDHLLEQPLPTMFHELDDILLDYEYTCPEPQDNIMDCIKEVYASSRGAELGTVSIPKERNNLK